MIKPKFKESFLYRYEKLTDIKRFIRYSSKPLRKSFRVNTLKISVNAFKKRFKYKLEQIPWCKEGFWVNIKDLGKLKEHSLGYIYVQSAASMIPPVILNPGKGELVLDVAAAPGSKATQIAMMMKNKGILVANDVHMKRIKALSSNLQRCGVCNSIVTRMYKINMKFDKILVDAPCSGTGIVRKSPNTPEEWSPRLVRQLAGTQKYLIRNAFENLKDNGILVYSTCSLEPEEDEAVIDYLLKKYKNAKLEAIKLKINRSEPILEFDGKKYDKEVKKCLRIWPQDNDSEGFFVAKIRKC